MGLWQELLYKIMGAMAKALYRIGVNLAEGKPALQIQNINLM